MQRVLPVATANVMKFLGKPNKTEEKLSTTLRFFFHFIQIYTIDACFLYDFALNDAGNGVSYMNKSFRHKKRTSRASLDVESIKKRASRPSFIP